MRAEADKLFIGWSGPRGLLHRMGRADDRARLQKLFQ
jgi:hypothetical protein